MPYVALHPCGDFFAGQSLDNTIYIYQLRGGKFRELKKKKFTGHLTAGYACQLGFSPDGHWLYTGDGEGKVSFWDYNTGNFMKKFKAHEKACMGAEFHPIDSSRLITCGWDDSNNIKIWE